MERQLLSPTKQATFVAANSLIFMLVLPCLLNKFAQSAPDSPSTPTTNQLNIAQKVTESNLQDPIVWDASSLYKDHISGQKHSSSSSSRLFTRKKRSTGSIGANVQQQQQLVDSCPSKMEIITPYYASNSKGKLRTIVNSELMQQAIQVETCIRAPTSQSTTKCNEQPDCGCEQKYKWHRLLVLDPRDSGSAKGLFMDWFLFPSSCVCRCKSAPWTSKHFLRTIKRTGNGGAE